MSAAGEMQFNPGVIAQDIRRLSFVDLLYRHRLALLSAMLVSLGQKVGLDIANSRKAGSRLLRYEVAAFPVLHDGRVRGARRANNCTQANKQFFTCLHFLARSLVVIGVLAGGRASNSHFIACSSYLHFSTWNVWNVSRGFLDKFLVYTSKKLVKKA